MPYSTPAESWLSRLLAEILQPLHAVEEEQRAFLASPAGRGFDVQTSSTLVVAAIMLTLQRYVFQSGYAADTAAWASGYLPTNFGQQMMRLVEDPTTAQLAALSYWAAGQSMIYFLLPALAIKLIYGRPLSDYGLKLRGMFQNAWVYGAMYLVMVGPILWASAWPSFRHTYPFYRVEIGAPFWPRMIFWEALYATQFVSLEFFFRGFLLHGCRRRFGAYAIFVSMVPYCMIHFQKPPLETCGAIVAGIVLGYMSLSTRSIWLGAALHIAVAITMDAAALLQPFG